MKRFILGALTLAALSVSSAVPLSAATTTPTPAQEAVRLVAHYTTFLDLTTSQQTTATTIFTTEFTALAALKTSLDTAHTALIAAIEANDSSAIATQAAAIGALDTQEVSARATASAAFYAILTTAQQTKYVALGLLDGHGFGAGPSGPHH